MSEPLHNGVNELAQRAAAVTIKAKAFLKRTALPAVVSAMKNGKGRLDARATAAGGLWALLRLLAPKALIMAGLLGLLALFLPVASFEGMSLNYMDAPGSDGVLVIVLLLAVLGVSVFRLVRKNDRPWSRWASGITAILAALVTFLDGAGTLFLLGLSLGAFMMTVSGLALGVFGLATLVPVRRNRDEDDPEQSVSS